MSIKKGLTPIKIKSNALERLDKEEFPKDVMW